MTEPTLLALFTRADAAALALLLLSWAGMGWWVEHAGEARPSVAVLMERFRHEWMQNHVSRDPRVFDALLLASLRQGTAFFASTCLLVIGGGLALLGNTSSLDRLAQDVGLPPSPALLWDLKVMLPVLLITFAFLKFVRSHRVFGYAVSVVGAIPNPIRTDTGRTGSRPSVSPDAARRARRASNLIVNASRAFSGGMRSTYFALASLGWILGPWALMLTTLLTVGLVWHYEFNSDFRHALQDPDPLAPSEPRRRSPP